MRILNCTEAVTPAIARTQLLLFTPFRWGRTWKLSATAYLSFVGVVFAPFMLFYLLAVPFMRGRAPDAVVAVLVTVVLSLTVIYTIVFVLVSRLQFAFFDIALNRSEFVAPAWRKYGQISWPWTLLKIAAGVLMVAVCLGPCIVWGEGFVNAFVSIAQATPSMQAGQPPPPQFFALMAEFYGFYFVALFAGGAYYAVMSTLSSFMVPSMALEAMSPRAAFARFTTFVRRETGAFLAFVGLRLVMAIAGYFCLTIALEIVLLIVIVVVGGLGLLVGVCLHAAGVPSDPLLALGMIIGIPLLMAAWIYILPLGLGPYFTFFEAHTLYFLGGRYPMLGDLLERSTPAPSIPAPPQYSYADPYPAPPAPSGEPPNPQA